MLHYSCPSLSLSFSCFYNILHTPALFIHNSISTFVLAHPMASISLPISPSADMPPHTAPCLFSLFPYFYNILLPLLFFIKCLHILLLVYLVPSATLLLLLIKPCICFSFSSNASKLLFVHIVHFPINTSLYSCFCLSSFSSFNI